VKKIANSAQGLKNEWGKLVMPPATIYRTHPAAFSISIARIEQLKYN